MLYTNIWTLIESLISTHSSFDASVCTSYFIRTDIPKDKKLREFFQVVSTNKDRKGKEFISTMEGMPILKSKHYCSSQACLMWTTFYFATFEYLRNSIKHWIAENTKTTFSCRTKSTVNGKNHVNFKRPPLVSIFTLKEMKCASAILKMLFSRISYRQLADLVFIFNSCLNAFSMDHFVQIWRIF